MDISILLLNSAYDRSPNDLGIVILMSHVDENGKASTSEKQIEGMVVKPVAGSLVAPLTKSKISVIDTSENCKVKSINVLYTVLILTLTLHDIVCPMHDNCLLTSPVVAALIRISYHKTIQRVFWSDIKSS